MSAARFSCGGPHSSAVLGASRAWLCEFGALGEPSGRHFESAAKWYYHFPKACSDTGLLPITLSTSGTYDIYTRLTPQTKMDGSPYPWNPFHYQYLSGDDGAMVSRGPLMDLSHERAHDLGCLSGSGACRGSGDAVEQATTEDIDGLLRASGLPTRENYNASSFQGVDQGGDTPGPGSVSTLRDAQGNAVTAQSGSASELTVGQ